MATSRPNPGVPVLSLFRRSRSRTAVAAFLGLLCCLPAVPRAGLAAESTPVRTDHDTATLVTDADGFAPGRPLGVGLRLQLAPGWHTYWSNPGDAGEPATVQVSASGGGTGQTSAISWPTPQRLAEGPLMSFAYTGDVLLPLRLVPEAGAPGAPLRLKATADWLSCSNVCVPEHGEFTLDVPPGPATPSPQAPLFAAARAALPTPSPFPARIAPDGTLTLTGDGLSPGSVAAATVFPDQPGLIDQAAPQHAVVTPGTVSVALKPLRDGFKPDKPFDALVVLRDPDGQQRSLSVQAVPGGPGAVALAALPPVATAPLPSAGALGFSGLLLSALLGGIILNLMPCVFPVLAMKALSLARLSGLQRRAQRLSALFYTLGILVAFAVLGGGTLALREAGRSVGWGIQFQSPLFVAGTCWLLFVVGLNLLGVFEIGGRLAGAGQSLTTRGGHGGDFATGLLAVLVATPCAAPFMVTAVAGALSAPAIEAIPVFLAMGLGLALPYIVFALVPRLVGLMPRPGAWMAVLKQALSFPVFGTCVWLLWVSSYEAGPTGVLAIGAGLVLLGAAAWLFGLSQRLGMTAAEGPDGRRPARFAAFLALGCVLVTLALLRGLAGAAPETTPAMEAASGWEPFTEQRFASLRAEHHPVLVDMSAAWCVSCLVNEKVALDSAAVRASFRSHDVALLRGDWTNRNPAIAAFLRAHGRDGVPFYLYVSADGTEHVWPQILTPGLVEKELGRG